MEFPLNCANDLVLAVHTGAVKVTKSVFLQSLTAIIYPAEVAKGAIINTHHALLASNGEISKTAE